MGEAEGVRFAHPLGVRMRAEGRRKAPPLGFARLVQALVFMHPRVEMVTQATIEVLSWAMRFHPRRRHVPHFERHGGVVFLTWRLAQDQPPLRPEERGIVLEAIRSCEPLFAELIAAVVMDDHAHALVRPHPGTTGRRLARAWKGMSAQRLVKEQGRVAPIWQREYFDRWMDSSDQTRNCATYIRLNPVRRWPDIETYEWSYPPYGHELA